jgi:signal transduction histidine kinase
MPELFRRALSSVQLRLTMVATLVFAVAFALASVALVWRVRVSLEDGVRAKGIEVLDRTAAGLQAGVPLSVKGQQTTWVAGPDGTQVFTGPVGVSSGESVPPGTAGQVLILSKRVNAPTGAVTVSVASPLDGVRRSVDTLVRWLWVVIPGLVGFVAAIAWFLAGRALRPVEVMSARQREFVSDASHELRSPVTSMRAQLEVALKDPHHANWPTVARGVLDENVRLGALVDDLLELARFDEAPSHIRDEIDLDDIVLEDAGSRTGAVKIDTHAVSGGCVVGNGRQLHQVVRNLVDNAARHANSTVRVGVTRVDGHVVLNVDDDGPGIAPADRQRVFDRFTRLDDARGRHRGGAGLGLAVVARIVHAHGGRVSAGASPELGGARFVVELPAFR